MDQELSVSHKCDSAAEHIAHVVAVGEETGTYTWPCMCHYHVAWLHPERICRAGVREKPE